VPALLPLLGHDLSDFDLLSTIADQVPDHAMVDHAPPAYDGAAMVVSAMVVSPSLVSGPPQDDVQHVQVCAGRLSGDLLENSWDEADALAVIDGFTSMDDPWWPAR